jgi:hypothetical protein
VIGSVCVRAVQFARDARGADAVIITHIQTPETHMYMGGGILGTILLIALIVYVIRGV